MKIEVWSRGGLDGSVAGKWTVVFHRVKYAIILIEKPITCES